jgi:hypothetical protein
MGQRRLGWILAGAVVVLSSLLLGIGGLSILPPLGSQAGAYLADRNLGLAVLLLALLALRWTRSLAAVLLATAAMHVVDGLADVHFALWPAAVGSLVVATISAAAAVWILRQPAAAA